MADELPAGSGGLVGTLDPGDWTVALANEPGTVSASATVPATSPVAPAATDAAPVAPVTPVAPTTDAPAAPVVPVTPKPGEAATPPVTPTPDAPADPWQAFLVKAQEEAAALGFKSPEEYRAAQERIANEKKTQETWQTALQTREDAIFNHYQKEVTDGRLAADVAQQLHDRDIDNERLKFTLNQQGAAQEEQALTNDLAAVETQFPLLKLEDGLGSVLVKTYAQANLGKPGEIAGLLNTLLTSAGQKAVADYVAGEAAKVKNTAPVLPTGGGTPPVSPKNSLAAGDWWNDLK